MKMRIPGFVVAAALVVPSAADAQFDHLTCFTANDSIAFRATVTLDALRPAFVPGDCEVKGKAKLFCVPTSKVVTYYEQLKGAGGPQVVLGPEPIPDRVCYKVKCPRPAIADTLVTDQFGSRNLLKLKKVQYLCTPAVEGLLAAPICGDGSVEGDEECDDGNTADGDCCTSGCQYDPVDTPCTGDGNDCTSDLCNASGTCVHANLADGSPCSDDDPCTGPDECLSGICANAALCTALPPNADSVGCESGSCFIGSCVSGWFDVDQSFSDGCECQADAMDQAGAGNTCGGGLNLGVLPDDGSSSVALSGNIVPLGDSDWAIVTLSDAGAGEMRAAFTLSGGASSPLRMEVYTGGCSGGPVGPCHTYVLEGMPGQDDSVVVAVRVSYASGAPTCNDYTLQIASQTATGVPGWTCLN